jgi:uncharacterized protein (DUF58 family)
MTIGALSVPVSQRDALARARQRASNIPDLLVDAKRLAMTTANGWHGRRRRGIGENFWQFRPYVDGEAVNKIDWRRSARDDNTYIRDREWEAAHTVWLWADPSASMLFQSKFAQASKESRALVLMLAMAELLSRSGERIAWPGIAAPFASRNGAEKLSLRLAETPDHSSTDFSSIKRFSDLIIASDFLDPLEEIFERLQPVADRGVKGHLIEVVDPVEESFAYAGRLEFIDPETGEKLKLGRAENFGADYRNLYFARREELRLWAGRFGWSFTTHHTDRPASEPLTRLHLLLAEHQDIWS